MCSTFFPDIKRPFHTTDVIRTMTDEKISALNTYFNNFMFFRVARTMTIDLENSTDVDTVRLITISLLEGIKEIGKWTRFKKLIIILEDSDRLKNRILGGLHGYSLSGPDKKIEIELCYMSKDSCFPALEVADLVVHTAGRQSKIWKKTPGKETEPDFNAVFKSIDSRLCSFLQIQRVENKNKSI